MARLPPFDGEPKLLIPAIELLVITIGYWPVFAWRQSGYEYTLMWGLILFAIALRGPGPYSLDRRLGVTL